MLIKKEALKKLDLIAARQQAVQRAWTQKNIKFWVLKTACAVKYLHDLWPQENIDHR